MQWRSSRLTRVRKFTVAGGPSSYWYASCSYEYMCMCFVFFSHVNISLRTVAVVEQPFILPQITLLVKERCKNVRNPLSFEVVLVGVAAYLRSHVPPTFLLLCAAGRPRGSSLHPPDVGDGPRQASISARDARSPLASGGGDDCR